MEPTMDGMVPGMAEMVGMARRHGLELPKLSSNPPTGGMTTGEIGTTNGTDGILPGDGIPHGEQDPPLGDMETGTGTPMPPGEDPQLPQLLEQELFILKHLK